jgi:hypothetical protein
VVRIAAHLGRTPDAVTSRRRALDIPARQRAWSPAHDALVIASVRAGLPAATVADRLGAPAERVRRRPRSSPATPPRHRAPTPQSKIRPSATPGSAVPTSPRWQPPSGDLRTACACARRPSASIAPHPAGAGRPPKMPSCATAIRRVRPASRSPRAWTGAPPAPSRPAPPNSDWPATDAPGPRTTTSGWPGWPPPTCPPTNSPAAHPHARRRAGSRPTARGPHRDTAPRHPLSVEPERRQDPAHLGRRHAGDARATPRTLRRRHPTPNPHARPGDHAAMHAPPWRAGHRPRTRVRLPAPDLSRPGGWPRAR